MNRKKKFLVVDVETANSLDDPLVYDVGYAVCDKDGNIYHQDSWIILDIFDLEPELMQTAYYADKIPIYQERLKGGQTHMISLQRLRWRVRQIMQYYNIDTVCAYNAHFDITALNTTLRYLTKSKARYFFPYGTNVECIWHMCCQCIYSQKKYVEWALENDFISDAGNIMTRAEIGKKYIDQNLEFIEMHMGLDDVLDEIQLMSMCYKKHQKMDKGIKRNCWQIPTRKYKDMVKKYIDEKRENMPCC